MTNHDILRSTLSVPTAPFHEHRMAAHVRAFAEARGRRVQEDQFGNLIVRCTLTPSPSPARGRGGRGEGAKPIAFVAHMDHPGFEVESVDGQSATLLAFGDTRGRNAVGTHIRAQTVGGEVAGVITKIVESEDGRARNKRVAAKFDGAVKAGDFAQWDFPGYARKGKRVLSRAIDDVAGVAALLAAMDTLTPAPLSRLPKPPQVENSAGGRGAGGEGARPVDLYAVFTRAEEVGFVGATALAKGTLLPESVPVVSIEMSRALPGAEQGKGYVVRLGDRMTMFDPSLTQFLLEVARSIGEVPFQQRLMDGGACEATAFNALGYRASGVCLPLGNYHNQGEDGLAPEYIHEDDWNGLVRFIVAVCERMTEFNPKSARAREICMTYYERFKGRLR